MTISRRTFATSLALAVSGLLSGALAQSTSDKITVYRPAVAGAA